MDFSWICLSFFQIFLAKPKIIFSVTCAPSPPPPLGGVNRARPLSSLSGSLRLSFTGLSSTPPLLQPFYRGASAQRRPEDAETAPLKGNSAFLWSAFLRVAILHASDSLNPSYDVWRADGQAGRRVAGGSPPQLAAQTRGKIAGRECVWRPRLVAGSSQVCVKNGDVFQQTT